MTLKTTILVETTMMDHNGYVEVSGERYRRNRDRFYINSPWGNRILFCFMKRNVRNEVCANRRERRNDSLRTFTSGQDGGNRRYCMKKGRLR